MGFLSGWSAPFPPFCFLIVHLCDLFPPLGPLHDIHPAAVFFDTGSFLIYLRLSSSRLPFNLFVI